MKKLFALITVLFLMGNVPAVYAEEVVEEEPVVEDPVVEEEPIVYEDEIEDFIDELNLTLTQVFAWIGGFSGLGALLAFAFRFIKDKGLWNELRSSVQNVQDASLNSVEQLNNLVETIGAFSKREAALEKSVINLISMSSLDPRVKKQVIEGLENDTLEVGDVLKAGLVQVKAEVDKRVDVEQQIEDATVSLLQKLSQDEEA